MSFKDFKLHPAIESALTKCGYIDPTPIQRQAIGPALEGRDLLGLAQTGTGKTAAFILPILNRFFNEPRGKVRALIVSPTRELAEQTHQYIGKLASDSNLGSVVVYGGVSKHAQINNLKRGPQIVVACPGRLLDLVKDRAIDLSNVQTLVLDEADHMFDQGFLPDIRRIIKLLPVKRQNLVFSATMPTEIRTLVEGLLSDPFVAQINHTKSIDRISHTIFHTDQGAKAALLKQLLREQDIASAIIFTRTKYKAKNLALQLQRAGINATSLQGNLSQQKRQQALDGFRDGTYPLLVATDIAARGIDVSGISHVINFDMPETAETYTHRTGRTGRANRTGTAITFATADDEKMTRALSRLLGSNLVQENIGRPSAASPLEPRQKDTRKTTERQQPAKRAGNPARSKRSTQRKRSLSFDFGI